MFSLYYNALKKQRGSLHFFRSGCIDLNLAQHRIERHQLGISQSLAQVLVPGD